MQNWQVIISFWIIFPFQEFIIYCDFIKYSTFNFSEMCLACGQILLS